MQGVRFHKDVSHLLLWNNTLYYSTPLSASSLFLQDWQQRMLVFLGIYLYLGYDDFFLFIFEESLSLCFVAMPFILTGESGIKEAKFSSMENFQA